VLCISFALCWGSARHKTWRQNSQQHRWWPKQISLLLPIRDLQTLCNNAGAKAVHRRSQAKDFKTAISQILTFFSNTKLRSQRGQARQRNSRSDNYTYAITVKRIKNEKSTLPDPFTHAVIKLLKPQAPAAVDFLHVL